MDIAKIRKKAREQAGEKKPAEAESPEASGVEAPQPAAEQAEFKEQVLPEAEVRAEPENKPEEKKPSVAADNGGESDETLIELLTFSLASEEFALRVTEVEEILRLQKMTQVPTMPDYVTGITSLRGKIIPVIDLKRRLGLTTSADKTAGRLQEHATTAKEAKILIVAGAKGMIGATIDRVLGVVRVARDKMLEPPAHLTEAEIKYIEGIVILDKRFISVLRSEDTMDIEIG